MAEWFAQYAGSIESPLELYTKLVLAAVTIFTVGHVLLHKRNPRPAVMWVVACVALPGFGALLYWMFGFNRISTRTRALQERWPSPTGFAEIDDENAATKPLPAEYREIAEIGQRITGRRFSGGNHLRPLRNGGELYPPMLEAIRGARTSIWLSTYIFDRDDVGLEFADALSEAVSRGVDVRVLIDGLGEWYSPRRIGKVLLQKGVAVERFLSPSIIPPSLHVNLRYHRKLMIVDSRVAFTGGMNIGARHLVAGRNPRKAVRDLHFEVEGPAVAEIEEVFREDWTFAHGECQWPLAPVDTLAQRSDGAAFVRPVSSGPNEDLERLRWIILGVLSQAQRRVRIMTPYFIAESSLVAAMNAAVLRGVRIELILPKRNNLMYMTWAARAQLWQILEFGVRVYEQAGAFSHTKLILVDDGYALIGSANLDPRSLRLNFEFNLEVCDGECPRALDRHFAAALKESREVSLEDLEARPLWMKLRDSFAALFSPYL